MGKDFFKEQPLKKKYKLQFMEHKLDGYLISQQQHWKPKDSRILHYGDRKYL